MIGPGTGLAPFRGFLQQRAASKAKGASLGPAMLFFGCRHPEQDYLYADELKAFAADGITELHTAFSRGDGPKTYVQHLIAAQKDRVWSLIEQGATIYVCGDGSKMEPDVKAALVAIYRERAGADEAAGQRWIDDLGANNRYVLDVWAGGKAPVARWSAAQSGAFVLLFDPSRIALRSIRATCFSASFCSEAACACLSMASMICGHIAIGRA